MRAYGMFVQVACVVSSWAAKVSREADRVLRAEVHLCPLCGRLSKKGVSGLDDSEVYSTCPVFTCAGCAALMFLDMPVCESTRGSLQGFMVAEDAVDPALVLSAKQRYVLDKFEPIFWLRLPVRKIRSARDVCTFDRVHYPLPAAAKTRQYIDMTFPACTSPPSLDHFDTWWSQYARAKHYVQWDATKPVHVSQKLLVYVPDTEPKPDPKLDTKLVAETDTKPNTNGMVHQGKYVLQALGLPCDTVFVTPTVFEAAPGVTLFTRMWWNGERPHWVPGARYLIRYVRGQTVPPGAVVVGVAPRPEYIRDADDDSDLYTDDEGDNLRPLLVCNSYSLFHPETPYPNMRFRDDPGTSTSFPLLPDPHDERAVHVFLEPRDGTKCLPAVCEFAGWEHRPDCRPWQQAVFQKHQVDVPRGLLGSDDDFSDSGSGSCLDSTDTEGEFED